MAVKVKISKPTAYTAKAIIIFVILKFSHGLKIHKCNIEYAVSKTNIVTEIMLRLSFG